MEIFETSNLVLATVLSIDWPLKQVRPDEINTSKIIFGFEDSKDLRLKVEEYKAKKIRIEPQEFHERLREVRTSMNEVWEKKNN